MARGWRRGEGGGGGGGPGKVGFFGTRREKSGSGEAREPLVRGTLRAEPTLAPRRASALFGEISAFHSPGISGVAAHGP